MLELGMIICLALMGVYFVKSTDLPKELKDRSAQSQSQASQSSTTNSQKPKMNFSKFELNQNKKSNEIDNNLEAKLLEMKQQKKVKDIALLHAEIDRLTLEITSLEQQIKDNNAKNAEIQIQIDAHLMTLMELQKQVTALT